MNYNPTNPSKNSAVDGALSEELQAGCKVDGGDDLTSPVASFDEMNLNEDLLRGIYGHGFESPSLIQQRAIRPLACGTGDLIAQAQSGTGKTATFSIGLLQLVDPTKRACQAIILSPTRELAKQSASVAASLVLDEADEMLSLGFRDNIYDVLQKLPRSVRLCLFSATLPPETLELAQEWMPDAQRVIVKKEELTLEGIKSYFVFCGGDERAKLPTLLDLYAQLNITQAVIFVNHRRKVEWLSDALNSHDFTCSPIHSELTQEERDGVMQRFKSGQARVLIATDVLARGIDVQQVNLVVNFDLPRDRESYIHRVGRSGRFGRKGSAINLLGGDADVRTLREIEQHYATTIDELPIDLSVLA